MTPSERAPFYLLQRNDWQKPVLQSLLECICAATHRTEEDYFVVQYDAAFSVYKGPNSLEMNNYV